MIPLVIIPIRIGAATLARLVGGAVRGIRGGARGAGRARSGFRRSRLGRGLDATRTVFAAINPFDDLAALFSPSGSTALPQSVRESLVRGANRLSFDPTEIGQARNKALAAFDETLRFRELPDFDREAINANLPIVRAEISRAVYRAAFRIRQSRAFNQDSSAVNSILHEEIARAGERAQARITAVTA
jgi:hypothetical protein